MTANERKEIEILLASFKADCDLLGNHRTRPAVRKFEENLPNANGDLASLLRLLAAQNMFCVSRVSTHEERLTALETRVTRLERKLMLGAI